MSDFVALESTEVMIKFLGDVKAAITSPLLHASLIQIGQDEPPVLTVVNTHAPGAMSADVHCESRDGVWFLFSDWGEIGPADRPGEAAERIRHVLVGR